MFFSEQASAFSEAAGRTPPEAAELRWLVAPEVVVKQAFFGTKSDQVKRQLNVLKAI